MGMMETKHIHKLRRRRYQNGTAVFFCVGDDCTFKIGTEFSLGKKNLCWRCGQEFKLTPYSLRLAKPHCEDCHNHKDKPTIKEVRLDSLLNEGSEADELEKLRDSLNGLMKTDEVEL